MRSCRGWYERDYGCSGFLAQRLYPNEELLRFLGRRFFSRVARKDRSSIHILEVGCGSCSNLWMIAREGFAAHGIDLSRQGVRLGRKMLRHWNVKARLAVGSMSSLPYSDGSMDVVADVFSSYCLPAREFRTFLQEVRRVLKPKGVFFSYTPSVGSDAFKRYRPARKIDPWTLDGIRRKDAPYSGNLYPFRFVDPDRLPSELMDFGLKTTYLNTLGRTYNDRREYFEFAVIEAERA